MHDFPVKFNPSKEELEQLPPDTQVVIEGIFAGYFDHNEPERASGFYVDTPKGRMTVVTYPSPNPWMERRRVVFIEGVIENLYGKAMMQGDKIRYIALATRGILQGEDSSAHLLQSCEERQADYDQLRQTAAAQITILERTAAAKQYCAARSSFAQLRQLELTDGEWQHIKSIMEGLPRHERSVYTSFRDANEATSFKRAFGVNAEALKRAQFLMFAFEVVRGVRKNPTDAENRASLWWLYNFLLDPSSVFMHQEKVSLLRASLWASFQRLESGVDNYDDDRGLLEGTITNICAVDDEALVHDIERLIEYCIGSGYFKRRNDQSEPHQHMDWILACAFTAIEGWKRYRATSARITRRKALKWRNRLIEKGLDDALLLRWVDRVIARLK